MGGMKRLHTLPALLLALVAGCSDEPPAAKPAIAPMGERIDATVRQMMQETGARGFSLAIIDDGQVAMVKTYGERNAAGTKLETNSILYAASLTKMTFATLVMQLVDEGVVDLDKPIGEYLPMPLPEYVDEGLADRYARYSDLAGDERWRQLTPRILLNHGSGFANFGFLEPDEKLRFHFDPGTRYSYSGDGIILLQFVLEQGLGLDVGKEMQTRIFDPLGMKDTSMIWRNDFAGRAADGWTVEGKPVPHDDRSRVRAAGSMDTTIADMAKLVAAIVDGRLVSAKSRQEFVRPQLAITTASQFPTLQEPLPPAQQRKDLAAGVGVVTFDGPQGHGFYKGGHDDSTGNTAVCLEAKKRCVVILGNDLRAESAIPYIVDFILGPTGTPWTWEYGGRTFWQPAAAAP